jgi:hypothetical protein
MYRQNTNCRGLITVLGLEKGDISNGLHTVGKNLEETVGGQGRKADCWRNLVQGDGVVTAEMVIETIAEAHDLDDFIADTRLKFYSRS